MTTHTEVRRYPFGDPIRLDPHPLAAKLQREEPISRVRLPFGGEAWLVTRYADVRSVLSDPRFGRAATVGREDVPRVRETPALPNVLTSMDPPELTRVRKLTMTAFTSRRVQELRPRAERLVDELLTAMAESGSPADLVTALALPVPVTVICEMLGVPAQDQHRFREFSDAVMSTTLVSAEERMAAYGSLATYLTEQIAVRRADPTDDLLGALVAARDNEDRLTEDELVTLGITLLVAGHETTANQIANFTYVLLTTGEWDRLREDPDLVPAAVEELLRYVQLGNGGAFPRIANEDVELSGTLIRAGEALFVDLGAANRDEDAFPDAHTLTLDRHHNSHLAFGHGFHHCVGAQLARLELQVTLTALLRRFPTLHLAVPADEIPWKTGMLLRGPKTLPVAW
ncbi:cytochrome P450 [Nocardia sp. CDC153]|uniref:cytochrome P450 n=1 Tax=Nocardia sp. CDC153 TaxID=3112167 RepID=UPI002DB89BB7|nr:cytochrome P450 [Nocardia sp. CDC153]MEC3957724.1 cytochrome P450 [Nocardia sp. CDC153]